MYITQTIDRAADLVRKNNNLNFNITNFAIISPDFTPGNVSLHKDLNIELDIYAPLNDLHTASADFKLIVEPYELEDGSDIDKFIGGEINKYPLEMRQILRMAYILFTSVQFVTKDAPIDFSKVGWQPRITNITKRISI